MFFGENEDLRETKKSWKSEQNRLVGGGFFGNKKEEILKVLHNM